MLIRHFYFSSDFRRLRIIWKRLVFHGDRTDALAGLFTQLVCGRPMTSYISLDLALGTWRVLKLGLAGAIGSACDS